MYEYGEPKTSLTGAQTIQLRDSGSRVTFEVPGSTFLGTFREKGKDHIQVHLTDPKTQAVFTGLQKSLLKTAVERTTSWFKKDVSLETIKSILHPPYNHESQVLTLKIVEETQFFDTHKNRRTFQDVLDAPCTLKILCKVPGVCFIPKRFGFSCVATQVQITYTPLQCYAFLETDTDQDSDIE